MVWRVTAAIAVITGSACGLAGADDKDLVKEKLFAAKVAYDAEMQKFRKLATDWFDKREEAARKAGDKKTVDQVKSDRKAFDEDGDLPKTAPSTVQQKPAQAKRALEAAYAQAVKEYTKAKLDDQAAAVEKELETFRKGVEPAAAWVARFPPGMYNETSEDGGKATVDLRRDGTFTHIRGDKRCQGTFSFVDGKLILKCDEFVAVWTHHTGGEIKFEGWWPVSRYPKFKSQSKGTVVRSKN